MAPALAFFRPPLATVPHRLAKKHATSLPHPSHINIRPSPPSSRPNNKRTAIQVELRRADLRLNTAEFGQSQSKLDSPRWGALEGLFPFSRQT